MKKFTLALIAISSLFLSACGEKEIAITPEEQNTPQLNTSNWNTSEIETSKTSKAECIRGYTLMWKSNSANEWKGEAELEKNANTFCDAQQGMQNNDPSSCEKSEGILKISCYSEIAKKTKNPVICEKIEESLMRGACYSNIAEETKDPTVCDKIESDIFKASCLDGAKK